MTDLLGTPNQPFSQRDYNREWMRRYRRKNREQCRERDRILKRQWRDRHRCFFGCGRPAAEKIERLDPQTGKKIVVDYCGVC